MAEPTSPQDRASLSDPIQNPKSKIQNEEVLDLLAALVEKSLVLYEEQEGEARYRLLETVRQYGRDRLLEANEAEAVRGRHLGFFLRLAEEGEPYLIGAGQLAWLTRLEGEYDNLRAALEWSAARGQDAEAGLRLAVALGRLWDKRSYQSEGREWLERSLAAGGAAPAALRAKALATLGWLALWQGDMQRAMAALREGESLARRATDQESLALALGGLAYAYVLQGDAAQGAALAEENMALCREMGGHWVAAGLFFLALAAARHGDAAPAAVFEEARSACRETGDLHYIAACCLAESHLALHQGKYDRAASLLRDSLAADHELGYTPSVLESLDGLAVVWAAQGEPKQAARLWGAVEAAREALRLSIGLLWRAEQDHAVGTARRALGESEFAAAWAEGRAMLLDDAVAFAVEPAV